MAYTTSGSSLLNDVMPQIKQYKATTGRDMSANIIQGLLQQKLKEDAAGAEAARRLDLAEQAQAQTKAFQDSQVELAKNKEKAAATQGLMTLPATALGTIDASKKLYAAGKAGAGYLGIGSEAAVGGAGETAGGIAAYDTALAQGATQGVGAAAPVAEGAAAVAPVAEGAAAVADVAGAATAAETAGAAGAAGVAGAAEGGGAAAQLTAYDAAVAEGAAAGVGTAGATEAGAATGAQAGAGSLLGGVASVAGAGYLGGMIGHALGGKVSDVLGTHEKTTRDVMGVAGGALAGAAMGSVVPIVGTVVGAIVGGVVGLISSASVICSELLRQGKITEKDRKWAIQFKNRFISDDMFEAYLIWAKPYVEIMQRGGVGNDMLHDRMMAFVSYMINMAKDHGVTKYEKEVYDEIWGECIEIALTNSERKVA